MGKALVPSLPNEIKKAYVVVEFIVDTDGTPVNFKVVKGVDEDFDDELITVLEKMPVWLFAGNSEYNSALPFRNKRSCRDSQSKYCLFRDR